MATRTTRPPDDEELGPSCPHPGMNADANTVSMAGIERLLRQLLEPIAANIIYKSIVYLHKPHFRVWRVEKHGDNAAEHGIRRWETHTVTKPDEYMKNCNQMFAENTEQCRKLLTPCSAVAALHMTCRNFEFYAFREPVGSVRRTLLQMVDSCLKVFATKMGTCKNWLALPSLRSVGLFLPVVRPASG